jgi:hypothetical protein
MLEYIDPTQPVVPALGRNQRAWVDEHLGGYVVRSAAFRLRRKASWWLTHEEADTFKLNYRGRE